MAFGGDDAAIIAAGIQAAGAVGSTLAGSVKKRGSTRMMEVSKELAKYNTDLSADLYSRFQSPLAQVRQYREAGLNPNLLGNGAAAGAPSAGQVNTDASAYGMSSKENMGALIGRSIQNAVGTIQNYLMNDAKISNDLASAQALESQKVLNQLRAENQEIQNNVDRATSAYKIEDMSHKAALGAIQVDIQNRYGLIEAKAKYEKLLEDTYLTREQRKEVLKKIDWYDQQINESEARVQNMQDQIRLGFGQLALGNANLAFQQNKFNQEFGFRQEQFAWEQDKFNRSYNLESNKFQFNRQRQRAGLLFGIGSEIMNKLTGNAGGIAKFIK